MPLVPLVQEISQERRGTIKARQAFGMDQPDLPQNEADVQAMALAAHLLYDRLQALSRHCSDIEALKLNWRQIWTMCRRKFAICSVWPRSI